MPGGHLYARHQVKLLAVPVRLDYSKSDEITRIDGWVNAMVDQLKAIEPSLYLDDETAWLEQTAELVAQRRWDDIDRENLSEYLLDMSRRDRREVLSRLTVLLSHLLKWEHQPDLRKGSWEATIRLQRSELHDLLEAGTLRNHAIDVLAKAYQRAVEFAAAETGLPASVFPAECAWTLESLLEDN